MTNLLLLSFISLIAWADKPANVVEVSEVECIIPVTDVEAPEILKRAGVTVIDAKPEELAVFASAVKSISYRSRGLMDKMLRGIRIHVQDEVWGSTNAKGERAQLAGVQTAPNDYLFSRLVLNDGHWSTAYMIHEFGHRIGNSGFYGKYNRGIRQVCDMTVYATHRLARAFEGIKHKNRNEEFAEDFSAYIVSPQFFAENCAEAYAYFEKFIYQTDKPSKKRTSAFATYPYQMLDQCVYPVTPLAQ